MNMIRKQERLINRGYVTEGAEAEFLCLSLDEKTKLLQSKIPTDRTLGARLLTDSPGISTIEYLINALIVEKKLYSKIEICNSLVSFGQLSIKPLITILGKVGTNQHKKLPEKGFKKSSYPLPRDIASRTLIRIGKDALPELVRVFGSNDKKQLSEAIDAVGFICFYNYEPAIFEKLRECFSRHHHNNLVQWKIIRAMSGFPESVAFLQEQKQILRSENLLREVKRSLALINIRL